MWFMLGFLSHCRNWKSSFHPDWLTPWPLRATSCWLWYYIIWMQWWLVTTRFHIFVIKASRSWEWLRVHCCWWIMQRFLIQWISLSNQHCLSLSQLSWSTQGCHRCWPHLRYNWSWYISLPIVHIWNLKQFSLWNQSWPCCHCSWLWQWKWSRLLHRQKLMGS